LGLLDVGPDEVLHLGDSLRANVGGAAPLGIRTAWITRRNRDPQERLRAHEGPAPTYVSKTWRSYRRWWQSWRSGEQLLSAAPSA
jgi:FMN phosphatase YigB (HAD superfamily)